MKKRLLSLVLFAGLSGVVFYSSSCKKMFEGPAGATGPAGRDGRDGQDGIDGIDGSDGIDGVDGMDGLDGKDGNANVIGTNSFTPSWTAFSDYYYADVYNADITTAVRDKGLVMVYQRFTFSGTSTPLWFALPHLNGNQITNFFIYTNYIRLIVENIDGTTASNPTGSTYRAVIIPSSVMEKYPNTDWKNYEETMRVLKNNTY